MKSTAASDSDNEGTTTTTSVSSSRPSIVCLVLIPICLTQLYGVWSTVTKTTTPAVKSSGASKSESGRNYRNGTNSVVFTKALRRRPGADTTTNRTTAGASGNVVVDDDDDDDSTTDLERASRINKPTKIAFLMSFPNSGTSYTLVNTEQSTGFATGTNYGDEPRDEDCCVLMNVTTAPRMAEAKNSTSESVTVGPFLHRLDLDVAPYTLTKTHCDVLARSYEEFEAGCRTVLLPSSGKFVLDNTPSSSSSNNNKVLFDDNLQVSRAVHLLRSPLSNLVARKHLAVRIKVRKNQLTEQEERVYGEKSAESFRAWCRYLDHRAFLIESESGSPREALPAKLKLQYLRQLVNEMEDANTTAAVAPKSDITAVISHSGPIPCVSDLYRYVQWHNWAVRYTSSKEKIPEVHVLYYEDYTSDYNATVESLFAFLGLSARHKPHPFEASKTYDDYYTDGERLAVAEFVKEWSTPASWKLLRRYCD